MRKSVRTLMMTRIPIHLTGSLPWRKTRMFLTALAVAVISILGTLWPMAETVSAASEKTDAQLPADLQRLEGRWVRPDGGYVLELSEIKKDGSLKASYFNPRPINVFTAKWSRKGGEINLFVELRDVNYPGSIYNLQYDSVSDRLKGTYFQAVEKQTFDVWFVRKR